MPGEDEADRETWAIWQANNLDDDFDQGLLEATIGGTAYTLVEPNGTPTGRTSTSSTPRRRSSATSPVPTAARRPLA
jgi:hypothetical protein